jgi:hypothetical protein
VLASSVYAQVGCLVHAQASGATGVVDLFIASGTLYARRVQPDGSSTPHAPLAAKPQDGWIRVQIDGTTGADAGAITARVRTFGAGGVLLDDVTLSPVELPAAPVSASVECGIGYADLGGSATSGPNRVEVLVDDVELDACP